jgi:hypothetical protein
MSACCLMRAVMNKADQADRAVRLCVEHEPDAAKARGAQFTHARKIIDLAGRRDGHAS